MSNEELAQSLPCKKEEDTGKTAGNPTENPLHPTTESADGYRGFSYFFRKMVSEVENAIEHFTITEATMIKDYSGDFRSENQFFVGNTVDVLQENVFQSFLTKVKGTDKLITAAERHLEIHRHTRHYSIKSLLVHLCKVHPMGMQEFMAGMLGVMLIVGIVDNALQVAFIVADLKTQRKLCRFYHRGWEVGGWSYPSRLSSYTLSSNIQAQLGLAGLPCRLLKAPLQVVFHRVR